MNDLKNCPLIKQCRKSLYIHLPLIIAGAVLGIVMLAGSLFFVEDDVSTKIMGIAAGLFMLIMCAVLTVQANTKTKTVRNIIAALPENEFAGLNEQFSRASKAGIFPLYIMDEWIFYAGEPFLIRLSELMNFSVTSSADANSGAQSYLISFDCGGKFYQVNALAGSGIDPDILSAEITRRMHPTAQKAPAPETSGSVGQMTETFRFSKKDCPLLKKCRHQSFTSADSILQWIILAFFAAGSVFVMIYTLEWLWRIAAVVMAVVCIALAVQLIFTRARGLSEMTEYLQTMSDEDYSRLVSQFVQADTANKSFYMMDGWLLVPSGPILAGYGEITNYKCIIQYYNGMINGYKLLLWFRGKKREVTLNRFADFSPEIFESELKRRIQEHSVSPEKRS